MNFSRDMKNLKNRRKGKAGFTMSELLIVVAIAIVLFAVAVLSLVTIQKNLRQKELDSKAEILYVAVQNRMSELRAGGYESLYQYDENKDNGVAKVGLIPLDAPEEDAEDAITKDTLCYVVSTDRVAVGKAAASVLPESSVDAELWNNHWVIEYDPESGSVYSAFYSEEEITSGDVSTTLPTYLNRMRVRQTRLRNGAKIGYYGGARVISGTTDTLKPDISIDNREKLTATFYCNNPYADELTFNIKVSDGRNEYVKVVKYSELRQLNSKTWYYTWVMDSLESEKTRFYNQTDHKLACGTDITVTLSVESQNANVDGKSYTRKTNSLFRYAEGTPAGTALIAYGRHLQNLDEASHVSDTITGAVQVSDLSFADDTADNEDWHSFYGDTFTPITNKNLKSYDGYSEVDNVKLYSSISNLHITKAAQNGDAGLFSTFNGEIKNVTLTGMRIDNGGQNVGALIGSVSDTVKITNTRVYLSSKKGDLADIETVDSPEKVKPWLEGKVVGGLIGMVTKTGSVSVTDSSASTVIRAVGAAGGLIGAVYNAATITDSYADCYLTADRTGGLIAKAEGGSEVTATGTSITLKDFYAAGYQTATDDAFGLVGGSNVNATGGYSACVYNVGEKAKIHSTVNTMGRASNVYYLTDGGLSGDGTSKWENDNQTTPKTYKKLSESGFAKGISEAFTSSSGAATFPYNLMDQGLTYYTYPRLEKLNHYGDWQAEFESGALVYYERYEDETYGFYGANLSTLKTSKFVVGDGYALAYIEKKDATDNVTVTYANNQKAQVSFDSDSAIETTDDTTNTKYYLYPLSKEVVNTEYIDTAEPDTFYQKITIVDTTAGMETEYYYNPHFAKTVTVNENKPQAPETVCIRSARQLYALSLYYPQYADAVKDSVFRQELNIDYSGYDWINYDVVPAKINTQAPIGTGDKPFTAVYNGGCNTIEGISFKANSLYIGMFGYTSSAAAVRNVFLVGNGSNTVAYVNAQGGNSASGSASRVSMGVLVGYNRGTVSNCSVSGYTIQDNHANAPGWGGGSVGGLVGMTNMDITNCSAVTDIIINIGYNGAYQNLRVGGIAGVSRGAVRYCYAGGSMRSTAKSWYSNYNQGANIWMGGLVGGIVMRNSGGLATLVGDVSRVLKVENCYSYVEMPKRGKANEQNIIKSTQAIASNGEMQERFSNVKNDYIEIHNCYALESAVLNTDDYRKYGDKTPSRWYDLNLNMTHQDLQGREIKLFNDSTPYVTYAEMQSSEFLTKLNKNYQSGSSYKNFSTVTITEQGQNIDGKYSFPGNDTALQGLNYPFPTVLTQTDIFGSTVNLHYGRWPRIGLLWEENSRKLDLLADIKTKAEDSTLNDNENGKALLQTHLLIASSDVNTSAEPPKIKLYDEDRNELTNDKAAATVSRIAYNREDNCYDVTFIGQNVGTVVAEAKLGNYIARLTIEVTASLKLEASSTNISVYSGDTDTITLTVKDANDKQLLAETEKTLRWEIAVDNNGVQQDVIECSKDDIKLNADGTFSLPLTGFAAGEATVSITCTYPYGAATAAEPTKEVTATLYISATTKPSDVLGLTNGSVYNQISLPHTPKKSTTSYTGTTVEYPENGPAMKESALFLYATDEYTDLNGFTVDQIEITAGETAYTVGEDGITTDENHTYKVTVNDQWTTETNDTKFRYRAVKVESAAAGEITLKIVLKNGDVTYNLTTPYTIVFNEYKVKFVTVKGDLVLEKKVSYGEKPTLTEEEKNKLATAILGYTFDFDNLPEIFADTEIKAVPNTYTIQFDTNGGLGTMPDESYAYDKIQTTDSLLPNTFTKGTSTFKGWAVEAEGAVQYTDMSSIQDIVNSMAMGNKTKLTLYAVWEDTAAGGETVEP